MTARKKAEELFTAGYNCAQSVAAAFGRTDEEEAYLLSVFSGFGGGFARSRGLCGALAGLAAVLGRTLYDRSQSAAQNNARVYAAMQADMEEFCAQFGSTQCGELLKGLAGSETGGKPGERTEAYYAARPCLRLVDAAVRMGEERLAKEKDRS